MPGKDHQDHPVQTSSQHPYDKYKSTHKQRISFLFTGVIQNLSKQTNKQANKKTPHAQKKKKKQTHKKPQTKQSKANQNKTPYII